MSKVLEFTYNGKDYMLEYTKETVKEMERAGFVASEVLNKPMSLLPSLFAGAFRAHHRTTSKTIIDEIFNALGDKEDLLGKLAEMYQEPLNAMLEEPEDSKKVEWKANW